VLLQVLVLPVSLEAAAKEENAAPDIGDDPEKFRGYFLEKSFHLLGFGSRIKG
jgi:hypothetical protein